MIDAYVYVFRAYHALPPIEAPDGTPTHAAYGFASTLMRWLERERPTHAAAAFDFSMRSFRNELEPGYKAGRTEPPPDLAPQFALCFEVVEALGLPGLRVPSFEADDVIATLTERCVASGAHVVVVSADKDLAQLVREDGRVVVFDLAREETLDADGVRGRFGVSPAQIPDYLALVGDAVDNLPGVPGVGPKTASALLGAFGSLDAIPADSGPWAELSIRGAARLAERIASHRKRARRIRELATVRRDVPDLPRGVEALAWRGVDRERARALFARLGWVRLADRLDRAPLRSPFPVRSARGGG